MHRRHSKRGEDGVVEALVGTDMDSDRCCHLPLGAASDYHEGNDYGNQRQSDTLYTSIRSLYNCIAWAQKVEMRHFIDEGT